MQPAAVIADLDEETREQLKEAGIPVLSIMPARHKWHCSLSEEEAKKSIRESEKKGFLGWLDRYKRRK